MIVFINNFNTLCMILFTMLYFYQGIFMFLSFFVKPIKLKANKLNKFAVIIPARNEEKVISNLIESISAQNYPNELIDVYVIADNCNDNTEEIAKKMGATVYSRKNIKLIGKGFAMKEFFTHIKESKGFKFYDGYVVFDADNILDNNYFTEINNVFDNGYKIVTGYRNSKNFGQNWVSASTGVWFLRDCVFMHKVRMKLGITSNVTGTGFVVSSDIIESCNGWNYHLMTEDIEFSVDQVIKGEIVGYAHDAIYYDEQPISFAVSWKQRKRWVRGFYQVLLKYWKSLLKGSFIKGDFNIYDMFMLVAPGNAFTIIIIAINFIFFIVGLLDIPNSTIVLKETGLSIFTMFRNVTLIFFIIGFLIIVSEWKRIYASTSRKIFTICTFPIYMISYIPISILALFWKPRWEEIKHTNNKKISDIH